MEFRGSNNRWGVSVRNAIISLIKGATGDEGKRTLIFGGEFESSETDVHYTWILCPDDAGCDISAITDDLDDDEDAMIGYLPPGIPIAGDFHTITITSGRLCCYKKLPKNWLNQRKQ